MNDIPHHTARKDLTPRRYPLWAWAALGLVFYLLSAGLLSLVPIDSGRLAFIALVGATSAIVLLMIAHHVIGRVHIKPHGDRVEVRHFRTTHTLHYMDLRTITFVPGTPHSVHLATQSAEIRIDQSGMSNSLSDPFADLMEELGEMIGWDTSVLTVPLVDADQSMEPIVLFDADDGDRINNTSVFARKLRDRRMQRHVAFHGLSLLAMALPLAYAFAMPTAGEMGFDASLAGIAAPIVIMCGIALGYISTFPNNRFLWTYAGTLAALAALGYVFGHLRAGAELASLVGGAALCFVLPIAAARSLRAIGVKLEARLMEAYDAYIAAIEAVIASGAVKDRSQSPPSDA